MLTKDCVFYAVRCRTFRLLRSVPALDGTDLSFSPLGDVIYSLLRRPSDDTLGLLNAKRMRHPLHAAFQTLDATNYQVEAG